MYVKKSDTEYWVKQIVNDLQETKTANSSELERTYNRASGKIAMLYHLHLITLEQWKKLTDLIFAIAFE